METNRLIDLRKKKLEDSANRHKALLDSNLSIKEAVLALNETINNQKPVSLDVLVTQLEDIKKLDTYSDSIKSLENSIRELKDVNTEDTLQEIIKAIGEINNKDIIEAINILIEKIESQSIDQSPEAYQPIRRVIKIGQRLVYDDDPMQVTVNSGGGSGGIPTFRDSNGRITQATLINGKVPVDLPMDIYGHVEVALQDQYSEPIDLYMCRQTGETTLSAPTLLDAKTCNVIATTGAVVGGCIEIIENGRVFQAIVQNITNNVITFNAPTDQAFTTNAIVKFGEWNMNYNGSVTPLIYCVSPPDGVKWDINRIIVGILDETVMDDGKFGGMTALTNGIVMRVMDSYVKNLFILSDNSGWRERSFDVAYADKAPAGKYGFGCRKTFNGQDKSGVSIRLDGSKGDMLQLIVQDDLTPLLKFAIVCQGHVVE